MFQIADDCRQCERLTVVVESANPIRSIRDLPNTYDPGTKVYSWKYHECMGYTLVPRSIEGTRASLDLYLCIDSKDREAIDIRGYAERFLRGHIVSLWSNVRFVSVSEPVPEKVAVLGCRKSHRNHV